MGRNNYFQFKQFRITQEHSAMKVGTDGVLLGAWVNVSKASSILDIGAGTGVISIMAAQRSCATVIGIEIEENAANEAAENAGNSPWNNRISILHTTFQAFSETCTEQFDLIVSNPPFFTNSQKSKSKLLAIAKHNHLLPLSDLVEGAEKLLSRTGTFAVILPVVQAKELIKKCKAEGLSLCRLTKVRPNNLKPTNRYLMEFIREECTTAVTTLNIHTDKSNGFTEEYKTLTRDFYLNF
ncbi:tRNA1Val (adenine37-N6)-methyltransferase [Mariniphaga anaerophila]|uniref:tRNA1(Val) (adenine(37)-N6)-methyltransferase n=1 Tax=Mariniphaga anaerophila TaxID=1484053 RepID=A0A1M5CJ35_9BACT|nr:methyltransferase [Mariniphaga anaerophila]SHF54701.1 tRNA1Val (adenine37-N6)-methyltransferase [Mariniphaga anaerophila]